MQSDGFGEKDFGEVVKGSETECYLHGEEVLNSRDTETGLCTIRVVIHQRPSHSDNNILLFSTVRELVWRGEIVGR